MTPTVSYEGYTKSLSLRWFYRMAGPEEAAEAFLFLHGIPFTSYAWRHVMEPMERFYRLVAPDLPGFGQSEKPDLPVYDRDAYVEGLDGFLGVVGIERVNIVAHDFGAAVALAYALAHPERVSRLVLMNTTLAPRFSHRIACSPAGAWLLTRWAVTSRSFRLQMRRWAGMENPRLVDYYGQFYCTPAGRGALRRVLRAWNPRELAELAARLGELRCPSLLLWGVEDRRYRLDSDGKFLASRLPQAELKLLQGAGHLVQEEASAAVTAAIQEFVKHTAPGPIDSAQALAAAKERAPGDHSVEGSPDDGAGDWEARLLMGSQPAHASQ